MWNLLEGRELFTRVVPNGAGYSARYHLAEMVALLGPPPKELTDKLSETRTWHWSPEIRNEHGELCDNMTDWSRGPFFDEEGRARMNGVLLKPADGRR